MHMGNLIIYISFGRKDCQACSSREQCTRSSTSPRKISIRPREQHEALRQARERQTTEGFQERYAARAGIEGTISQGVRVCDLRRSRYIGLTKTHLQNLLVATALNLIRITTWLRGDPLAKTQCSPFAHLKSERGCFAGVPG